jgi:hypothetical protein
MAQKKRGEGFFPPPNKRRRLAGLNLCRIEFPIVVEETPIFLSKPTPCQTKSINRSTMPGQPGNARYCAYPKEAVVQLPLLGNHPDAEKMINIC